MAKKGTLGFIFGEKFDTKPVKKIKKNGKRGKNK